MKYVKFIFSAVSIVLLLVCIFLKQKGFNGNWFAIIADLLLVTSFSLHADSLIKNINWEEVIFVPIMMALVPAGLASIHWTTLEISLLGLVVIAFYEITFFFIRRWISHQVKETKEIV